ncbi:unnamed protein product [Rhizophagus irregularis]|nr:unnamed protein product [Rhizophagus irregularis]
MEEKSDLNETSDKTNKSTSKSVSIKSILKSAKLTKLTQEESDNEVIEIEPPNIPKEMLLEMKKRYGNIQILQKFVLVVKDNQVNKTFADENNNLCKSLNRIKTKKSEQYEKELEEEESGSNNNDEYDEKKARVYFENHR